MELKKGGMERSFQIKFFFPGDYAILYGCAIYFDAVALAVVFQSDGIPITLLIIHLPPGGGICRNLEDGDAVLGFPIPVYQ
jgi:hypothetical protein